MKPAFVLYERFTAATAPKPTMSDGLPLPPALMRMQVVAHADPDPFLALGQVGAATIRDVLSRNGVELESLEAILDFGCGCGRTARNWATLDGPEIHGCDYNADLVKWCQSNLPFINARVNQLHPPLPYEDAQFDFVYALSVFTHLTEQLQRDWISEMRRVIRPGGHILFTTMGDKYRRTLDRADRRALRNDYDAGRVVINDQDLEGTNRCVAYHPPQWVKDTLLTGFALVEFKAEGSEMTGGQDYYFARRL